MQPDENASAMTRKLHEFFTLEFSEDASAAPTWEQTQTKRIESGASTNLP